MKKLILFPLLFASRVSFHNGAISSGPLLSTKSTYVDVATGHAKTFALLGFGGINKDHLVFDAKRIMMRNRPLKRGEYYANFSVDFKRTTFFLVYLETQVFVHADILSERVDSVSSTISDNYKKVNNTDYYISEGCFRSEADTFCVGEKVYYFIYNSLSYKEFEIISFTKSGYANLKYTKEPLPDIIVKNTDLYYSLDKSSYDFKRGDMIIFTKGLKKEYQGKIIAVSKLNALVYTDKETLEIPYKDIIKKIS